MSRNWMKCQHVEWIVIILSKSVTMLNIHVRMLSERVTMLSERVTMLSERVTLLSECVTSVNKKNQWIELLFRIIRSQMVGDK